MGIISLSSTRRVVIIVAHPDDETLWAGGTILENPQWECLIISLCRGTDPDRSVRFRNALKVLNCDGLMGSLDDGPEQKPLNEYEIDSTILELLPSNHFDLIITHDPGGEYTRHRRHEETGKSVIRLWFTGNISAPELWTFAYDDDNNKYPTAVDNANIIRTIPPDLWLKKYNLITGTYGFKKGGFEAGTTPKKESFWRFTNPEAAMEWIKNVEGMKGRMKTKTI